MMFQKGRSKRSPKGVFRILFVCFILSCIGGKKSYGGPNKGLRHVFILAAFSCVKMDCVKMGEGKRG